MIEIDPENIPALIEYNGWVVWSWTGWKGRKSTPDTDQRIPCGRCGKPMTAGQQLYMIQTMMPEHWLCVYPDDRKDDLHAQWLAMKESEGARRYLYAECSLGAYAPAGEYLMGSEFAIEDDPEKMIYEDSSEYERDKAKANGLKALKRLIDRLNEQEV